MKPNKVANALDSSLDTLYNRASYVIERARETAYRQINEALVKRNWELGKLIAEEELNGQNRAVYGAAIIKGLSKRLTANYGKGFTKSYLYSYVLFYKTHPTIFQSVIGKSHRLLSWTHYYILNQELNPEARAWYEKEALSQDWSTRTLQRNISSQYFFRIIASQHKDLVEKEMLELTAPFKNSDPTEFIKNPVIGEFLGFTVDASFRESELEQAIINNLEKFLLELGKGFAFVARQQHIHTEKEDYYIDLVFYNIFLKCYVLIDLLCCVQHNNSNVA